MITRGLRNFSQRRRHSREHRVTTNVSPPMSYRIPKAENVKPIRSCAASTIWVSGSGSRRLLAASNIWKRSSNYRRISEYHEGRIVKSVTRLNSQDRISHRSQVTSDSISRMLRFNHLTV